MYVFDIFLQFCWHWQLMSTVGSWAFASAAPHIWNTLPTDIVTAKSLSTFRRLLKHFLLKQSVLSVLWRCWLGGRKDIWPVKNWVAGCWRGYLSGARVQTCIWLSWCHWHSLSLASVKSRLVLPFWYWLIRVVLDKGPLNGCVCMCVLFKQLYSDIIYWHHLVSGPCSGCAT